MAAAASSSSSPQYRSRFGDTTWTKVFVGGLAWETPTEELRRYFEQFGDILEAVVITDKATGSSKGYGFVTFRDAEAARRAVADPNPVIDGRRANCNIASLGRPRTSSRQGGGGGERSQEGSMQQGPPQGVGPTYGRVPAQMPHPMIYPTPFGYVAYPSDYGYHHQTAAMYGAQMASYYYPQAYGPTSPPNVGPAAGPYHFSPHQLGYAPAVLGPAAPPSPRPSFPPPPATTPPPPQQPQGRRPPFVALGRQLPAPHAEAAFLLQPPPHARRQQQPLGSSSVGPRAPPQQAASSTGADDDDDGGADDDDRDA